MVYSATMPYLAHLVEQGVDMKHDMASLLFLSRFPDLVMAT